MLLFGLTICSEASSLAAIVNVPVRELPYSYSNWNVCFPDESLFQYALGIVTTVEPETALYSFAGIKLPSIVMPVKYLRLPLHEI